MAAKRWRVAREGFVGYGLFTTRECRWFRSSFRFLVEPSRPGLTRAPCVSFRRTRAGRLPEAADSQAGKSEAAEPTQKDWIPKQLIQRLRRVKAAAHCEPARPRIQDLLAQTDHHGRRPEMKAAVLDGDSPQRVDQFHPARSADPQVQGRVAPVAVCLRRQQHHSAKIP